MRILSDKFVVEAETTAAMKSREENRKVITEFKQQVRFTQPVRVVHNPFPPDPRWNQLPEIRV